VTIVLNLWELITNAPSLFTTIASPLQIIGSVAPRCDLQRDSRTTLVFKEWMLSRHELCLELGPGRLFPPYL